MRCPAPSRDLKALADSLPQAHSYPVTTERDGNAIIAEASAASDSEKASKTAYLTHLTLTLQTLTRMRLVSRTTPKTTLTSLRIFTQARALLTLINSYISSLSPPPFLCLSIFVGAYYIDNFVHV